MPPGAFPDTRNVDDLLEASLSDLGFDFKTEKAWINKSRRLT